MTTGEIINLILSVLSFILAAISVITVVLTLRQNNKMIEATSRAYIVVNAQYINFRNHQIVLVVRNYGSSGAIIKKISFDKDLTKYTFELNMQPFEELKNMTFAPNQNLQCDIDNLVIGQDGLDIVTCNVEYISNGKNYKEEFMINFKAISHNIDTRVNCKDNDLKAIAYILQEHVRKNL